MLNIEIALVSSLGENGLRIFSHDDSWSCNTNPNLSKTALLGHEGEEHYHSPVYMMWSRPYIQVRNMMILRSTLRTGTVKEKQRRKFVPSTVGSLSAYRLELWPMPVA